MSLLFSLLLASAFKHFGVFRASFPNFDYVDGVDGNYSLGGLPRLQAHLSN